MLKNKNVFGFLLLFFAFFLLYSNNVSANNSQLIIVNKNENKTYFYENGKRIGEFSVATGRTKNLTPEGTFKVNVKWKCPVYYATNKKGCASDNPLGVRWIGFNALNTNGYTYGLHGTNAPNSIGKYASSGCIRMHKENIVWLFDKVNLGTKVIIISSSKNADKIAEENGYKLSNAQESTKPTPPKQEIQVVDKNSNNKIHIVKKSETLWRISKNYNVSLNDLKKWNNLKSDSIKVGQKLIVSKNNSSINNTVTNNSPSTSKSKKKVKVNGYLNVRSNANTTSKIIGKIKNGKVIETTKFNNKWSITYLNGNKGYVSNDYLVSP